MFAPYPQPMGAYPMFMGPVENDAGGELGECTYYFKVWQRKMDALVGSSVRNSFFSEAPPK